MPLKGLLVSFWTILRKDLVRIFRIWPQTFLPSIITAILYFLIFGAFLGSRIGELHGVPYVLFVVPGMVMLSIMMNAYNNVAFSFFSSKFFMRTIDEILVSPTPPWVIVAGYIAGGVTRGVLIGLSVLAVSLLFTELAFFNVLIIALFFLFSSLIFSLAGLINGVYAKSIDGINIVPTFVLTPLIYLGGIFYSINTLPGFWQTLSKFNPVFYLIDGFRYGFLGFSDVPLAMSISILIALTALLLGVAWYLLKTGLGLKT
jgi:ABC-2 type transport system permease protein